MKHRAHKQAFALIVTVIILALLAVMAVAFLSSSRVDRGTARGVADKVKADLAVQSAVNAAISRLIDNLKNYPDSATTWESVNDASGKLQYQGTTIYYRDLTPEANPSTTAPALHALPLISGAQQVQIPNPPQTASARETTLRGALGPLDNSNSYDLNHARFSGDTQGWIGAPPGSARPEYRGQWINLTDSSGKTTGRYAYWMEDESFKVNTNLMGNNLRLGNTLGNDPKQIPLQGMLATILPSGSDFTGIANSIFTLRGKFPSSTFFEYRALNQADKTQPTLADSAKFVGTIYSGAPNLSRSGSKRINLNKIAVDSTDATTIRNQLDQIIKTITYHLPNFAQRFYRNGSDLNSATDVSAANQTIYLNKIAANIRDYIDTDFQPTIVNNDPPTYSVQIGTTPLHSVPSGGASGSNEIIAVGKDAVPLIQEYMVRVKQIEPQLRQVATGPYKIEIDHYVEFWNMTNKDIKVSDLGANAFLRIANQFGWTSYGGTDIPVDPSRDFSIPLSSFTNASGTALSFPAGRVTVLTTDPVDLPGTFSGVDPSRVFRPPAGTPADSYRVYSGTCNRKTVSGHPHLDAITRPVASPNAADLETEVILGNSLGVLESFGAPAVYYITVNADDGTLTRTTERVDTTKWYFRASSLKGNAFSPTTPSQKGDPRTNGEQLSITSSVANDDQTAYKLEVYDATPPFNNASFTALNSKFVDPTLWADPAINTADSVHAPAVVANTALTSVGELGNIFDPARSIGSAPPAGAADINYSRGGGRTFKVGQPDDLWDGYSNHASREWTAWRLTDVFTTSDFVQLDGRVNINGVNRDGGAALKAAFFGYNFEATPDTDPNLAGKSFDADPSNTSDKINELVKQMQARVKNDGSTYSAFTNTSGPFAERGELSEMPMFNSGTNLVSGVNTASVYDRGREELFRRLVELTTTRGNIFTVYAVGQSLVGTAPTITATSQLKVTFRIDPVWTTAPQADPNWDPAKPSEVSQRFGKPDKYAIKILYAGE